MSNKLITLDNIKLYQKLQATFACSYSDDQRLSILSENGVYIFQLGCDTENRTIAFAFLKSFYAVPICYAISDNVDLDINDFIDSLDHYELYEGLLDGTVSQNLRGTSGVQVVPVSAQWSPKGVDGGQFCLLGVLTNTGVLELVGRRLDACGVNEYYCVCNVSECCVNLLRREFKDVGRRSSEQFAELKARVEKVRVTAFTWGDDTAGCYLFCGHGDGGISSWGVNSDSMVIHKGYHNSSLKHITALSWINGGNTGLLIIGDLHGKISALIVNKNDGFLHFNETLIYSDCDNIKIESIKQFSHNDHFYMIIVKGTFVIIAVFNTDCNLLDQKLFSCGNLAITGVEHYENNTIFILTYTGIIKQLQLSYADNKLQIESTDVANDVNWKKYRAHGLFLSHNRVFVGLVVHPSHLKDFAKVNQFLTVVILRNTAKIPMKLLLNNQTGSLEYYGECLEVLRTFGLKHKKYPCEKYPFLLKLDYDTLSLLEIKTLLHISKITRVIYSKKVKDINRNIESVAVLSVIMQIKLVIKRLKDLIQQHTQGKTLSQFQLNSMELADAYLREIILGKNLEKFGLTTNTVDEIYDVMAYIRNLEFPVLPTCFWCKNSISGLTCFPAHTDTRCALSFMQITEPVCYKCLFCKTTVHRTVVEEENYHSCPFCDLALHQTFFKDKLQGRSHSEAIDDLCAEDCLREKLDLDCVQEEAYVDLDDFGYAPKASPNFDELSISDASSVDDSDVDYIYEKELGDVDATKEGAKKKMEVD